MSDTGATPEQIEAAKRRMQERGYATGHPVESVMDVYVPYLVPPDHRIIGPEIAAAWTLVCACLDWDGDTVSIDGQEWIDFKALMDTALIGGADAAAH